MNQSSSNSILSSGIKTLAFVNRALPANVARHQHLILAYVPPPLYYDVDVDIVGDVKHYISCPLKMGDFETRVWGCDVAQKHCSEVLSAQIGFHKG